MVERNVTGRERFFEQGEVVEPLAEPVVRTHGLRIDRNASGDVLVDRARSVQRAYLGVGAGGDRFCSECIGLRTNC